jgi:APA family basic amino acid/polyamine antiporter
MILVGAALAIGGSHGARIEHLTTGTGEPLAIGSMGLALVSILWAYDGWADLSFASGEVKQPQVNLPRAIILGTVAIVVIYLATNAAYLYVTPIQRVAQSKLVAADTMFALFGRTGVVLVSIFVMISSFSSLNGSMLASPRVFFAMADDGLFFERIARVHPRFRTPYVAILLAALLGMILVLSRSFEALTDTFVLAIWPFYALGVAAIFRLRRLRPDLPRPYRAVGYPIVPAIFVVAVAGFVINALVNAPVSTVITFALIFTGAPVYYVVFRRRAHRG